jgi:hypothetical protein
VSGQSHAPAALPPSERAPDTHWIGGWGGGGQSRSGGGGEEKNSQLLPEFEPQIVQPVVQRCTTELTGQENDTWLFPVKC